MFLWHLKHAAFILCVTSVKPTFPYDSKEVRRSCSDSSQGSCCFEGTTLNCENLKCPDYLKQLLEEPCNEYTTIAILNADLRYLPLLDLSFFKTQTLEITNSVVDSLAPPDTISRGADENNIFKKLHVKHLLFNRVRDVDNLDWSFLANSNVRSLVVKESDLEEIPESFGGILKLERLQVVSSGLRSIHPQAFKKLDRLSDIDLSYNEIEFLDSGLFTTKSSFKINFSNNKLKTLPPDVLPTMSNSHYCALNTLNLNNNPLEELHPDAFRNTCLGKLYLNGTFLNCDCKNVWLMKRGYRLCGGCYTDSGFKSWTEFLYCECGSESLCDSDEDFGFDSGCAV